MLNRSVDNPGPGSYRTILSQGSPRFSLGKGIRDPIEYDRQVPGPGTYNPDPLPFGGRNL